MTDEEISSFYHSGLDWVNEYVAMLDDESLQHDGKKERSGRYKWGSGKRPFQRLGGLAKDAIQRLGGGNKSADSKPSSSESSSTSEPSKKSFSFNRNKKPKDMTDEELDETIKELEAQLNRMNREKRVSDLREAIKNYGKSTATPNQKKDAGILVSGLKALKDMNGRALSNIGTQFFTYEWGTLVNNAAGKPIVNPKKGQKDK